MVTLIDAVNALNERKLSVMPDASGVAFAEDEALEAMIMSGFDLNHSDVKVISGAAGIAFYMAGQNIPMPACAQGAWVEGMLVGLMYAELKRKEDTHEESDRAL